VTPRDVFFLKLGSRVCFWYVKDLSLVLREGEQKLLWTLRVGQASCEWWGEYGFSCR